MSIYYEEALGFRVAWRTTGHKLTALASGPIEMLLLSALAGEGPPPAQSAYIYVEDPDALSAEYGEAGATIVELRSLGRSVAGFDGWGDDGAPWPQRRSVVPVSSFAHPCRRTVG